VELQGEKKCHRKKGKISDFPRKKGNLLRGEYKATDQPSKGGRIKSISPEKGKKGGLREGKGESYHFAHEKKKGRIIQEGEA